MNRRRLVRVPASSANLGPGYDCLAAALSLNLELEVEETGSFAVETDVPGVPLGAVLGDAALGEVPAVPAAPAPAAPPPADPPAPPPEVCANASVEEAMNASVTTAAVFMGRFRC